MDILETVQQKAIKGTEVFSHKDKAQTFEPGEEIVQGGDLNKKYRSLKEGCKEWIQALFSSVQ